MSNATITHIIPAHNEERYLPRTLESVRRAIDAFGQPVDVIVVDNVSTDRTAEIARQANATVVTETQRRISCVRNAGAAAASTPIITFADADSMLSDNFFIEVDRIMADDRHVGGNFDVRPDRTSFGLRVSIMTVIALVHLIYRIGGGSYFCRKDAFEAIGGFDESRSYAEDVDFAWRLKRHGKQHHQRYIDSKAAHIVTSMRKADALGDWYPITFLLTLPFKALRPGRIRKQIDDYFYEFDRSDPSDGFK